MGVGTTIGAVGIAVVAVVGLGYAAFRFLPAVFENLSIPNPFADFNNPFTTSIEDIRCDGPNCPSGRDFTSTEEAAFNFRELIGRPRVLSGETTFQEGGGQSIVQVDPSAPAPKNRFIFGSDFASAERLADLGRRFKLTGRDQPGGRQRRIQELLEKRSQRKTLQSPPQSLTNAQILGARNTIAKFSIAGGREGLSRTGKRITIGSSVFAAASRALAPTIRRRSRRR